MATQKHKAASQSSRISNIHVPEVVRDDSTGRQYKTGKFLGKGGFAKCYELTDLSSNYVYAGKVVQKAMLTKPYQRDKMAMEIEIHKTLEHKNIVKFHRFFEDKSNIYILLEICRRRSLMELHKRRKALTEPETRYFMVQILAAVNYLHKNNIIHRDLKLGNLFLNDDMDIKVGDFGLAAKVEMEGERKRTLCGTPNYIAPEVLNKRGHSFEVDIWSIGCVFYTLLVGKPPFETESLKETYDKIKRNDYHTPSRISDPARHLIQQLLRHNPTERPNTSEILKHGFFNGYIPARLPTSCLSMAPHFKKAGSQPQENKTASYQPVATDLQRKPLGHINAISMEVGIPVTKPIQPALDLPSREAGEGVSSVDWHLSTLNQQLISCLSSNPTQKPADLYDEAEDPAATPIFWISKWVDYSDKYGLGYQLCDTSVGVLFNDSTKLLLSSDVENMQYINRSNEEEFMSFSNFPTSLEKKVKLLNYFRTYMSEHLLKAGGTAGERPLEDGTHLPHLRAWFRTKSAIVLHLSNGTLQVNFFEDHTKIIICPLMQAVSYIDMAKNFRTFKLSTIEKVGCGKEVASRLKYAKAMVEKLLEKLSLPLQGPAQLPAALPTVPISSKVVT